jgi:hypothetical protein
LQTFGEHGGRSAPAQDPSWPVIEKALDASRIGRGEAAQVDALGKY